MEILSVMPHSKVHFFLLLQKSGEKPAFLFIQLVIPQGEDWRFSNILK